MPNRISFFSLWLVFVFSASSVWAEPEDFQALDKQVENLKKELIALNRELFILEEDLLFPATTQTFVFLSLQGDTFFKLDAVELQIDNKTVAHYLYTQRELKALKRGGVQKLHIANLKQGQHEIVAFFIGEGPNGREYRRGATLNFEKGFDPKYIELKISESVAKEQPEFVIREWE